MNLFITNYRGRNAHSWYVLELLGVKRLPAEGIPGTMIQGINVWVNPLTGAPPARGKRHTHRVMCSCPACGKVVSLGRLHQHAKIHMDQLPTMKADDGFWRDQ